MLIPASNFISISLDQGSHSRWITNLFLHGFEEGSVVGKYSKQIFILPSEAKVIEYSIDSIGKYISDNGLTRDLSWI
jgi:hypothetical protein